MNGAVLRALGDRGETATPLVIAFTKCDLVHLAGPETRHRLMAPFRELTDAVGAAPHVHGCVTTLHCGPRPVNIQVPVLWALRFGVFGRMARLQESVEANAAASRRAAAKDTVWDRVLSRVVGEPSWRSISADRAEAARRERAQLEPLAESAGRLAGLLTDVERF